MAGIIYYCIFLIAGLLLADRIFRDKSIYFKLWTGGIIGNAVLMAGIIPFALLFGFTKTAHVLLALAVILLCCMFCGKPSLRITKPNVGATLTVGTVFAVICVLLYNHIMYKTEGGISAGQSTYGDLAMHMGFVTSIAEQGIFPPQYNLLSGTRLCYPFLFDSLSSSLYLFGTDLRSAILMPSFVFAFLAPAGFYFLARGFTNRRTAVLAMVLFFFGGGFGFAYFTDGAAENIGNFTRIFTEFYQTPTNCNEYNIRWANVVCDMIVPQRTTMAGWSVLFFALWLLREAMQTEKRRMFVMLSVLAGCMPMIHTHSFLALGIISAVCFFAFLPCSENKKRYILNWALYGAITAVLASGQLFYWTFHQSAGNSAFVRISPGWVNDGDPVWWFWLKNWGIAAVFALPAFFGANGVLKRFCIGGAVLFIVANIVVFQPNEYDNNKLLFVSYMIAIITVSGYLTEIYERIKNIGGTRILAVTVIFFSVFSGTLTVIREFVSGGEYMTFSDGDMEFAEFVRKNTETDAVFISGDEHLNPISVLAGRNIYAGSELYVYYHGLGDELYKRYDKVRDIYEGENSAEVARACGAKYIVITDCERDMFDINYDEFGKMETVYGKNGIELYRISD